MGAESVATKRGGFWLYWLSTLLLLAGLTLTFMSWFGICTTACAEGHNYRLFGFTFEVVGVAFFTTTVVIHLLSYKKRALATLSTLLIASGLGAEGWFLYVQKFLIGSLCPLCVTIALTLAATAIVYGLMYGKEWFETIKRGEIMKTVKVAFPSMAALVIGFTLALLGTTKINPMEAAQQSLKESVAFGNAESPIEVYLFTDWFCPACRAVEPNFEKMIPSIESKAKLFFIDAAMNPESLNFTPYNLSFMIHDKKQYLALRKALLNVAATTKTPTDSDIRKAIAPLGVQMQELNFSDVTLGAKLFKKLARQFDVHATPTVVIVNVNTRKGKKLSGTTEITPANIEQAIQSLQ